MADNYRIKLEAPLEIPMQSIIEGHNGILQEAINKCILNNHVIPRSERENEQVIVSIMQWIQGNQQCISYNNNLEINTQSIVVDVPISFVTEAITKLTYKSRLGKIIIVYRDTDRSDTVIETTYSPMMVYEDRLEIVERNRNIEWLRVIRLEDVLEYSITSNLELRRRVASDHQSPAGFNRNREGC